MTQFLYDLCVFCILKGREPDGRESDTLLLEVIVRATLNAFWSRAPTTVSRNRAMIKRNIKQLSVVGSEGPYCDPKSSPFNNLCSLETAISVLLDSQGKGTYATSHKQ